MTGDRTKPCLVYTTFSGKIYIYYEVTLPSILPSNLLLAIEKMVFIIIIFSFSQYMGSFPQKKILKS